MDPGPRRLTGDEDGRTRVKLEDRLHAVWQMRCAARAGADVGQKGVECRHGALPERVLAQDGGAILREA